MPAQRQDCPQSESSRLGGAIGCRTSVRPCRWATHQEEIAEALGHKSSETPEPRTGSSRQSRGPPNSRPRRAKSSGRASSSAADAVVRRVGADQGVLQCHRAVVEDPAAVTRAAADVDGVGGHFTAFQCERAVVVDTAAVTGGTGSGGGGGGSCTSGTAGTGGNGGDGMVVIVPIY